VGQGAGFAVGDDLFDHGVVTVLLSACRVSIGLSVKIGGWRQTGNNLGTGR
jgi:hypothetical protein